MGSVSTATDGDVARKKQVVGEGDKSEKYQTQQR